MKSSMFLLLFFLTTAVFAGNDLPDVPAEAEALPATISGQIILDAKTPMSPGVLLLYDSRLGPPPSMGRYWRVPDLIKPLASDGKFSLEVPEGTYYLQAAQKNPSAEIGPAVEKEYVYFHGDADGTAYPLLAGKGETLKLGQLKAFLWTPGLVKHGNGVTSVEGVVADADGKPVERAIVLAYYNPVAQGRPVFISGRTDSKGRYQLRTNDGGTFFLKVRSVFGGGKPAAGEYLNTTNEFEPVMVTLKRGETLKNVTLKVRRFTVPAEGAVPRGKRKLKMPEISPLKEAK